MVSHKLNLEGLCCSQSLAKSCIYQQNTSTLQWEINRLVNLFHIHMPPFFKRSMTWHSRSCEPSNVRQLSSKLKDWRTGGSQGDLALLSSLNYVELCRTMSNWWISSPFLIHLQIVQSLTFPAQSLMATPWFYDSICFTSYILSVFALLPRSFQAADLGFCFASIL